MKIIVPNENNGSEYENHDSEHEIYSSEYQNHTSEHENYSPEHENQENHGFAHMKIILSNPRKNMVMNTRIILWF